MPYEKLVGRLSGIPDGIEGTWCCDDLAGMELGFGGLVQTHFVSPEWDLGLFIVTSFQEKMY